MLHKKSKNQRNQRNYTKKINSVSWIYFYNTIEDKGKISEISTNRGNGTFVNDLGSLIEAYKSCKITKKELTPSGL